MNLLDLLLALFVVVGVINGFRLGLLGRGLSWLGLAAGLGASLWTVPRVLRLIDGGDPILRLLVAVTVMLATVGLLSLLGNALGLRAHAAVSRTALAGPDRGLGAIAGGLSILAVWWLLIPVVASVPGEAAQQVRGSVIAGLVRQLTPQPPDAVQAMRRLVEDSRFPEVFEDLRPSPETGPPPSQLPISGELVARVEAATVNVEAQGCGREFEGSGWAAAPDTVVTNAHVVAGADTVRVRRPDGAVLGATVVVFDDDRDVAVLSVDGLGQDPLGSAQPQEGSPGAAVGYPGGQNQPRTAAAGIHDTRQALGRDIYGQDLTRREVVVVASRLQEGDSGGPVVDAGGNVVGTTFAISPDRASTAYALAPSEVQAVLDAPRRPGFSGRCM